MNDQHPWSQKHSLTGVGIENSFYSGIVATFVEPQRCAAYEIYNLAMIGIGIFQITAEPIVEPYGPSSDQASFVPPVSDP